MNKILFIDTMTTGLDPERCSLYRLGGIWCEETRQELRQTHRFEMSMRPFEHARISDSSLMVGCTTRSELLTFKPQEQVFGEFLEMLNTQVNVRNRLDKIFLAGFNVTGFDVPFLRNWFRVNADTRFRDYFYTQNIDLMNLAAWYLMDERRDMEDFHLETAARHLGVLSPCPRRGSCLDSADLCLKMYQKMCARRSGGTEPIITMP